MAVSGTTLFGVRNPGLFGGELSVFSVETDGSNFQTLHTFSAEEGLFSNSGLVRVGNTLFGTTAESLTPESIITGGTIFSLRTDGSDFQVLHVFPLGLGGGRSPNPLTYSNGRLYGTVQEEHEPPNINWPGPIFAMDLDGGNFEILRDRVGSWAGFTAVGDRFYGTTPSSIFSLKGDGSDYRVEHAFSPNEGAGLRWARLLPVGNRLYGVASRGGDYHGGTLFYLKIPEPSTLLLGLVGWAAFVRTRRKRSISEHKRLVH